MTARPWTRVAVAAAAVTGHLLARRWMVRWGATGEEVRRALPGDEIVRRPRYQQTHAVTIDAPPEAVWPWLAQLGQGRGGLYSYDWLENLFGCDIHSADRILPEHQRLDVGDEVRLVPADYRAPLHLQVAQADPGKHLVLRAPGSLGEALQAGLPYPSWAFVLEAARGGRTRLISRWRHDFAPTPIGLLTNKVLLEPVHFVMERKMLLGIKHRAEAERRNDARS